MSSSHFKYQSPLNSVTLELVSGGSWQLYWKNDTFRVATFFFKEDCLHLQLYRDSKDRYKQGQTKASLSLQHFLGVQSGFTLDKESNTVAIICQDVTVVLAFDTRERLIQWQVKIASNLGEDEQFLVQLSSAPLRAKLQPGPALLHVLEHQFCLTVGVPPRLVGHWQISQLRRYGVVESRFCFEGGSRCGKGEGLYVLVTDQGDEISRTFRLAADGKLTSKKRPTSRSASDSPKKNNVGRPETRLSDISCLDTLLQQTQISELRALEESLCDCECSKGEDVLSWHTSEHTGDFADTSSVTNYVDSRSKESRVWAGDTSMERCASCISKLGAVSRSSTAVITPNSPFLPAWTMEENKSTGTTHELKKGGEVNLAYENTQVLTRSECSTAEVPESWNLTDKQKIVAKERCLCCPPERPPKPGNLCSQPTKPIVPGSPKRCQNISSNRYVCNSSCSCNITVNPYDNYDVPSRASQAQFCFKDRNMTQNSIPAESEYYDTPKHVTENVLSQYVNYDIPPPVVERKHMSSSLKKNQYIARVVIDNEDMQMMACPCQRMMCWAENWMILPYCRRGNGRENTAQPLHKKTAVCEEQFLCNSFSSVYATVDKSKKTRNRQCCNKDSIVEKIEPQSASYVQDSQSNKDLLCSVDRQMAKITETTKTNASSMMKDFESALLTQGSDNYMNSAFLHSLEFYENSKDLRDKSVKTEIVQTSTDYKQKSSTTSKAPPMVHSLCKKCSHEPKLPFHNAKHKQDDYLMMEPSSSDGQQKLMDVKPICYMASCNKQVPGYLPMHPVGGSVFTNTHDLLKTPLNQQLMSINDRAASSPSLTEHNLDKLRKGFDLDMYRTSGTPNLTISHSMSASNSPYLRKRVLNCAKVLAERETNKEFPGKVKLPNSSLSSEEFDISLDRSENICTLQHNPNVSRNSNIRSKDISKQPIVHSQTHKNKLPKDSCDSLAGHEQLSSVDTGQYENIDWEKLNLKEPIVHIRSSSVPNKCSHNRDSSSSNDSGVSSCSMKRRNDLVKDDNLVGNIVSSRRYTYTRDDQNIRQECFHSSLPRRSKSVDPLSDIAFQFQKVEVPMKSSSAEAEVPVCHSKQEAKGCRSPSGTVVPYMDSRSTSSGTSDMSDYFETLSLSSYSSSDTHDSLHFGHQAVSTMRPRSGKEYQKIDRNFLEENVKGIPIPADIQNQNSNNEGTS